MYPLPRAAPRSSLPEDPAVQLPALLAAAPRLVHLELCGLRLGWDMPEQRRWAGGAPDTTLHQQPLVCNPWLGWLLSSQVKCNAHTAQANVR